MGALLPYAWLLVLYTEAGSLVLADDKRTQAHSAQATALKGLVDGALLKTPQAGDAAVKVGSGGVQARSHPHPTPDPLYSPLPLLLARRAKALKDFEVASAGPQHELSLGTGSHFRPRPGAVALPPDPAPPPRGALWAS